MGWTFIGNTIVNRRGGGSLSSYWTQQTLLYYTSRSGVDLLETGSGDNRNAKIIPGCAAIKSTDYIKHTIANFQSGDASGFIEADFYFNGQTDRFTPFATCDEGYDSRYFIFTISNKKAVLLIRSNSPSTFQNIITSTNDLSVGRNVVRFTSTGSAYNLTINGSPATFSVTGTSGANNGNWLSLVTFRDSITFGAFYSYEGTALKTDTTGTNKLFSINYNDEHKWIFTGAGNRVFDIIGGLHLTWTGTDHQSYDIEGLTLLLDSGYSLWKKTGEPDEVVPYKDGVPFDVSAYLATYEKQKDYPGGAAIYNFAPSLIDFDYTDSAHADLDIFDKSNSTVHIATAGMNYYDAANVYRWRQDELHPAVYSTAYKNVGYKGMMMAKSIVSDGIPLDISEIYVLKTDQAGKKEWKFAELCTIQDLAQQVAGEPVYDDNNYLIFFFSVSSYPNIIGDGITDDFAAIQALIDASPVGATIRLGESQDDVFKISQPIYLRSNRNYIIDGIVKIQDGETVALTTDVHINDHLITVADASSFAVGQWVTVIDDNQYFIRDLYFGWGGRITNITGNDITLEGSCNYDMEVSANARCGHSQGCVILDTVENITVSGSGKIDGNRYNQIAVLPSTSDDLLGYWEHQKCAMAFVVFESDNIEIDGLTIEDGLAHSLAISATLTGLSTNIRLKNLNVNTGHDKNILIRFSDSVTVENCATDGDPENTGTDETWEDGLIFYSNCTNCTVNGFVGKNCRRSGFIWNSNSSDGLVANNVTTIGCGTRTGYGVDIDAKNATISNFTINDSFRIGGPYVTTNIVATNIILESTQLQLPNDYLFSIGGDGVTLNNFIMQNSKSKTGFNAIRIIGTDVEFNGGAVVNHTGGMINQDSYNAATWNDFEGLIIS